MFFSEQSSCQIDQRALIIFGYPSGEEVYFDSRGGQCAGCFVEVELAESRRNDCFQTLLFDIHARLVIVVVGAAVILGVIRRLQIHGVQHHPQQVGARPEKYLAGARNHIP